MPNPISETVLLAILNVCYSTVPFAIYSKVYPKYIPDPYCPSKYLSNANAIQVQRIEDRLLEGAGPKERQS